ncbi:MAG: hypothetical protein IPI46_14860 [Bacteroidetes bacterium]|nr:hypothetical protein [Bacteroidota bacterium]
MKRKEHLAYTTLIWIYFSEFTFNLFYVGPFYGKRPLHHFIQAFAEMKKYHWDATVLYFGKQIDAAHYHIYLLRYSLPHRYCLSFCFAGFIRYAKNSMKKRFSNFSSSTNGIRFGRFIDADSVGECCILY